MNLRKSTSTLLAASVFLTGSMGALMGFNAPANAITSVDELSDVNRDHWAFEALQDLVEKYDVIEGYPDGTFRGNRRPTRWEMAAALNALVKTVGRDLARLGAEKADKRDLQTLARLQEEFRNELNALRARTQALENRASAIEAKNEEQDSRLSLLEKTQIHGDLSLGILSDISSQGQSSTANNRNGNGIADGISAVGRLRLALDIPIKEEKEDSKIGRGDLYTRLIAAVGRNSPQAINGGNNARTGVGANVGPNGPFSGYSRIASDAFGNQAFSGSNNTGGNTRSNLYVESAYYKQNFKSGIPVLTDWMGIFPDKEGWETTGDLYVGLVPWRFLFDKSPYRGNELTQFQNTGLVNTPGIPANLNMPMVAWQWHQGLGQSANVDVTGAVATPNANDTLDGFLASYEARLNYITSFLGDDYAKPGSFYAGGYHIFQAGNSIAGGGVNRGSGISTGGGVTRAFNEGANGGGGNTNGFYAGWSQEWFRGIGTFMSYHMANSGQSGYLLNTINQNNGFFGSTNGAGVPIRVGTRQSLSAALQVPVSALASGWRENDVFGVGYSLVDLHQDGIQTDTRVNAQNAGQIGNREVLPTGYEQVVEAYYKYQFTDAISIVPSVQFIFNRLGLSNNDFTTVLGLRSNFLF